jgi:hypothetical protein
MNAAREVLACALGGILDYSRLTMSNLIKIALFASLLTACKDKAASSGSAGDPKPGPAPTGKVVAFKQLLTDRQTAPDLAKIYPAGTAFETTAVLKAAAKCEADCSVELGDGGKGFALLTLDAANKAKLEAKHPGDELVLSCTPVYEGGALQFAKSCNVQ